LLKVNVKHPADRLDCETMKNSDVPIAIHPNSGRQSLLTKWHQAWNTSLRFRLLALGLMPVVIAFPFVVGVLGMVGGERASSLLTAILRTQLSSSHNYLDQLKADTGIRISQLVKSDRLLQQIHKTTDITALNTLLKTTAESSGFDFLVVAKADGTVLGSSTGVVSQIRLPDTFVTRQALIGVANTGYERFDAAQLAALFPEFGRTATASAPQDQSAEFQMHGLLINAGAHFPLAVNNPDAILLGGILLNRNFALIEHLREIIFPLGSLMNDTEGMAAIYSDAVNATISRQRHKGQSATGTSAPVEVATSVIGQGQTWIGRTTFGGISHLAGFAPLVDGDGKRIGMISVAIPDGPYRESLWLMLAMVGSLLALTMLAISVLFLRAGRGLTQRLESMRDTMSAVGLGDRAARVPVGTKPDELADLGRHFNALLDTIAIQDERQRTAQKTIADEAARRRALFEAERDGIVILNPDGSVFEANPKCAAMLGYTTEELKRMHVSNWDASFTQAEIQNVLMRVGAEGLFFETLERRHDGHTYPAEVSLSRAAWDDKTFVFMLQRDITERKAAEAELAQYRLELEMRVVQRTKELHDQSEQLNTIFALSPDGFVSFDRDLQVTFANRAFLRMTGLNACDIIGLDEIAFSGLLASRCLANALFPGMETLRSARKKLADTESSLTPNPAKRQVFELSGPGNRVLEVGIRLSEAESVAQILYFRDVTHETEVDRMKSEFLSTAAHELRTPMASIFGYSELLLMQEFESGERGELLTIIHRQSQLMASIINELLDLARIEARGGKDFHLERLALHEIVSQILGDYHPPEGRRPPVVSDTGRILWVKVDRKKMQQVVLNIISNAYKYSPGGGEVRVSLQVQEADGRARAGLEIQDPGIGMNAEQLGRVCERFYRADASGKIPGTGLGMSIVKEIVELLDGELDLLSHPGAGTTVTVWLPMATAARA
jgi:PAS domain S-box-containing protein